MEFQLGAGFEARLIDLICSHIKENPILISNLIEPSVNGIISDIDIKQLVTQSITQKLSGNEILTSDLVKTAMLEIVQDNVDLEAKVQQFIEEYFNGQEFERKVNDELENLNIDRRVDDAIEDKLSDRNIEKMINYIDKGTEPERLA